MIIRIYIAAPHRRPSGRFCVVFVHLFNTLNTAPHRTCKRACTVQPVHVHKKPYSFLPICTIAPDTTMNLWD